MPSDERRKKSYRQSTIKHSEKRRVMKTRLRPRDGREREKKTEIKGGICARKSSEKKKCRVSSQYLLERARRLPFRGAKNPRRAKVNVCAERDKRGERRDAEKKGQRRRRRTEERIRHWCIVCPRPWLWVVQTHRNQGRRTREKKRRSFFFVS